MKKLISFVAVFLAASYLLAQSSSGSVSGPGWDCALDNIGATLTLCERAPEAGQTLYITDIVVQSTTATGGQWILRTGTGANCAADTATLLPSASGTNVRLGAPSNTAAPAILSFRSPIKAPTGKDLCAIGVVTNTLTIQLWGYVGAQ